MPICLVECNGRQKHLIHRRDTRRVPYSDDQVECNGRLKHINHSCDTRRVPRAEMLWLNVMVSLNMYTDIRDTRRVPRAEGLDECNGHLKHVHQTS